MVENKEEKADIFASTRRIMNTAENETCNIIFGRKVNSLSGIISMLTGSYDQKSFFF